MIRSLRFKLTIWYSGIVAVVLCGFGWLLYTTVARDLAESTEEVLASQADSLADALFAFWEAGQALAESSTDRTPPIPNTLHDVVEEGRFAVLVSRWAQQTGGLRTVRPVRVMSREGQPIVESANFPAGLVLTSAALEATQHEQTVYETFALPEFRIRLVTRPVIEMDRVLYLVQVATSLRQADASLERLRVWLTWLIPCVLLLASVVGWLLVSRALKPVGRMTAQAHQIGAQQLDERIDVPRTGDELERLAVTFNDMLVRIEGAFKRLRQFSAAASHELRTPLTIMRGELEIALRKPRVPEEYQRVLRAQAQAVAEMTETVEELLALARSEATDQAIVRHAVDLSALSRQVASTRQPIATRHGIRLETPPADSVWVRGDARLMERLMANLLDNALKHTPAKGCVTIEVARQDPHACLVVRDTGPGIPAGELPQLFDRFFTSRSTSGETDSIGLGLGLCRWIAEIHHGRIEVASPAGHGAVFTVWLPLTQPPA